MAFLPLDAGLHGHSAEVREYVAERLGRGFSLQSISDSTMSPYANVRITKSEFTRLPPDPRPHLSSTSREIPK